MQHGILYKRPGRYSLGPVPQLLPDGRLTVGVVSSPFADHYGLADWIVLVSDDQGETFTETDDQSIPLAWPGALPPRTIRPLRRRPSRRQLPRSGNRRLRSLAQRAGRRSRRTGPHRTPPSRPERGPSRRHAQTLRHALPRPGPDLGPPRLAHARLQLDDRLPPLDPPPGRQHPFARLRPQS